MNKTQKNIFEDLSQNLNEVERDWFRIPITILIYCCFFIPLTIVLSILEGVTIFIKTLEEELLVTNKLFLYPCIKGPKNK